MRSDLRPFGATQHCDACQAPRQTFSYEYCEGQCVPDGDGSWMDIRTTTQAPDPHLHLTCLRCDFTWLEQTAKAQRNA